MMSGTNAWHAAYQTYVQQYGEAAANSWWNYYYGQQSQGSYACSYDQHPQTSPMAPPPTTAQWAGSPAPPGQAINPEVITATPSEDAGQAPDAALADVKQEAPEGPSGTAGTEQVASPTALKLEGDCQPSATRDGNLPLPGPAAPAPVAAAGAAAVGQGTPSKGPAASASSGPSASSSGAAACEHCQRLEGKLKKYSDMMKFLSEEHEEKEARLEHQVEALSGDNRALQAQLAALRATLQQQGDGAEGGGGKEEGDVGGGSDAAQPSAELAMPELEAQPQPTAAAAAEAAAAAAAAAADAQRQVHALEGEVSRLRQLNTSLSERCSGEAAAAARAAAEAGEARQAAAATSARCRQLEAVAAASAAELAETQSRLEHVSGTIETLTQDLDEKDRMWQEAQTRVKEAELKQRSAQVDVDKAKYDLQVTKNQAEYFRKQVVQKDKRLEELAEKVKEMELDQSRLPGEADALREEADAERQRAQQVQRELQRLQRKLESAEREVQEGKSKLEAQEAVLVDAATSIKSLHEDKLALDSQRMAAVTHLQQDTQQLQAVLEAQREESAAERRRLEQRLAEAQASLAAGEGMLSTLRQQAEAAHADAAHKQSLLDNVTAELPLIKRQMAIVLAAKGRNPVADVGVQTEEAGGPNQQQQEQAAELEAARREVEGLRVQHGELVGVVEELQARLADKQAVVAADEFMMSMPPPLPPQPTAPQLHHNPSPPLQPPFLSTSPRFSSMVPRAHANDSQFSVPPAQMHLRAPALPSTAVPPLPAPSPPPAAQHVPWSPPLPGGHPTSSFPPQPPPWQQPAAAAQELLPPQAHAQGTKRRRGSEEPSPRRDEGSGEERHCSKSRGRSRRRSSGEPASPRMDSRRSPTRGSFDELPSRARQAVYRIADRGLLAVRDFDSRVVAQMQKLLDGERDMVEFLDSMPLKIRPGKLHNPSAWIIEEISAWRSHRSLRR